VSSPWSRTGFSSGSVSVNWTFLALRSLRRLVGAKLHSFLHVYVYWTIRTCNNVNCGYKIHLQLRDLLALNAATAAQLTADSISEVKAPLYCTVHTSQLRRHYPSVCLPFSSKQQNPKSYQLTSQLQPRDTQNLIFHLLFPFCSETVWTFTQLSLERPGKKFSHSKRSVLCVVVFFITYLLPLVPISKLKGNTGVMLCLSNWD